MASSSLRVRPRVWVGFVVFLAYLVVFIGTWVINGIDYRHIGDSADTLLRWYVAPLAAGTVVLLVAVSLLGWWRPALFDEKPRFPAWVWLFPGVLVLVAVVGLFTGDTSRVTPQMWLLLVVGSILVGFNEEVVTRGQLIVALRSRFGELGVWGFSTLTFALLHLPNIFFGTGLAGLVQLVITFLVGSALYLTRRVAGTLIVAMIVHAIWDFSTFAAGAGAGSFIGIGLGVIAVIFAVILTRRESRANNAVKA